MTESRQPSSKRTRIAIGVALAVALLLYVFWIDGLLVTSAELDHPSESTSSRDLKTSTPEPETGPSPAARRALPSEPPSQANSNWQLEIVAAEDGAPIRKARVTLNPAREPVVLMTDSDGHCTLPWSDDGSIWLHVEADGRVTRRLHFRSPPAGSSQQLSMATDVPAAVLVRDSSTSAPIARASLFLQRLRPRFKGFRNRWESQITHGFDPSVVHAMTDREGRATLRGFSSGQYTLSAWAEGYCITTLTPVELPNEESPLEIGLERGSEIRARLVDPDGSRLKGWLVRFNSGRGVWNTTTDESGLATSAAYPAGTKIEVSVARGGLSPIAQFREQLLTASLKQTVTTPHPEVLSFRPPSERALQHAVEVCWPPPGDAADELRLELFHFPEKLEILGETVDITCADSRTVCANDGSVRLGASSIGRYQILACGSRSGLWRSPAFLVEGEDAIRVKLHEYVKRVATISGSIRSKDGTNLRGATMKLSARRADIGIPLDPSLSKSKPLEFVASTQSTATGEFEFPLVLPGSYLLEAVHDRSRCLARTVRVGATNVRLTLIMRESGGIRGTVNAFDPTVPMTVQTRHLELAFERNVLVRGDGAFDFHDLPEGSYALRLHRVQQPTDSGHLFEESFGRRFPATTVVVEPGKETVCSLASPLQSRTLHISLAGAGQIPDRKLEVVLERLHPFDRVGSSIWILSQNVDRSGKATIPGVSMASGYGVTVRERDGGRVIAWTTIPQWSSSSSIQIPLATATAKVTIDLAGDGRLAALVPLDHEGTPMRDTVIRPSRADDGVAVFRSIPYGRYRAVPELRSDHLGRSRLSRDMRVDAPHLRLSIH